MKGKSNRVFRDVFHREPTDPDNMTIWRKRGPQYWINPFFENTYGNGKKPSDFEPMYFESELHANSAFLILQSSLFYMFWMTYGDQRHLNWGEIEPFPFPEDQYLEAEESKIGSLTNVILDGMKERFDASAGRTGEIHRMPELKPLIDEVDELFGLMFGLSKDEIKYVCEYDREYGR